MAIFCLFVSLSMWLDLSKWIEAINLVSRYVLQCIVLPLKISHKGKSQQYIVDIFLVWKCLKNHLNSEYLLSYAKSKHALKTFSQPFLNIETGYLYVNIKCIRVFAVFVKKVRGKWKRVISQLCFVKYWLLSTPCWKNWSA